MFRAPALLLLLAAACTTVSPAPEESTFFTTAQVETFSGQDTDSGGDLWPSCWAGDGHLYTANGDGRGFGRQEDDADIVVSRVFGSPESGMSGEILSRGEAVANVWPGEGEYNRKPTGMLAIDGDGDGHDELYLAVQNLNAAPCPACFNDAPSASISRSDDFGRTWRKTDAPMFTSHRFTTLFFLDYGRSAEHARVLGPDGARYVYVYGLDHNWRSPTDPERARPKDLYLARVPKDRIQERPAWEFYAGTDPAGEPRWSRKMERRRPVLHDARSVYPIVACGGRPRDDVATNVGVISQGGVVYNAPLGRYLYTSWTWYTFEFYEAPHPWGPWRLFLRKDFGATPFLGESPDGACGGANEGGYPTTIPSKFISADGKTMWVQSNSWERWNYACGSPNYKFSLRRLIVEPWVATSPDNGPNPDVNLAKLGEGTTPIEKAARHGRVSWYNDGITTAAETSLDCDGAKTTDFWGYTWARAYNLDRVVYTSGEIAQDGGWFETLRVQVRRDFRWVDVDGLSLSPADLRRSYGRYVLGFDDTWGDGVRIIGAPGGPGRYTTLAELEVYYAD